MKKAVIKGMELDNMILLKLASFDLNNLREIKTLYELGLIDLTNEEKEFINKNLKER